MANQEGEKTVKTSNACGAVATRNQTLLPSFCLPSSSIDDQSHAFDVIPSETIDLFVVSSSTTLSSLITRGQRSNPLPWSGTSDLLSVTCRRAARLVVSTLRGASSGLFTYSSRPGVC